MTGMRVRGTAWLRVLPCLLVPVMVGCTQGLSGARSAPMDAARIDGAWVLREVGGVASPGSTAELVFSAASGEVHGSDGCNRLMGRFSLEDGRLRAKTASTRMACLSEPAVGVSRTLGALLGAGADAVEVTLPGGRGLLLRSGAESALFERRSRP